MILLLTPSLAPKAAQFQTTAVQPLKQTTARRAEAKKLTSGWNAAADGCNPVGRASAWAGWGSNAGAAGRRAVACGSAHAPPGSNGVAVAPNPFAGGSASVDADTIQEHEGAGVNWLEFWVLSQVFGCNPWRARAQQESSDDGRQRSPSPAIPSADKSSHRIQWVTSHEGPHGWSC